MKNKIYFFLFFILMPLALAFLFNFLTQRNAGNLIDISYETNYTTPAHLELFIDGEELIEEVHSKNKYLGKRTEDGAGTSVNRKYKPLHPGKVRFYLIEVYYGEDLPTMAEIKQNHQPSYAYEIGKDLSIQPLPSS